MNLSYILSEVKSFERMKLYFQKSDIEEVYVAGGAVRNYLIDPTVSIKDIDIFYQGDINAILIQLRKEGNLTKGPFGSWRWFPFDEITIYYDLVSINEFKHSFESHSMQDVLNQFDITVNAFAIHLFTNKLLANNFAYKDIESKIIRLVSFDYPDLPVSNEVTISRLSVLWFRVLHYSSKLKFIIEPDTWNWLSTNSRYYQDYDEFSSCFFIPIIEENLKKDLGL